MRVTLFFLLYLSTVSVVQGQDDSLQKLLDRYNSHSIPYISVEELRMYQITNQLVILDAREKVEFDVSHIPSAKYVGFTNFSSDDKELQKLNKNSELIVYCSVGIRSEKIGEKLRRMGFKNVKNLYGGIFEWKNKGFEVVDSTAYSTENIHAYSKQWSIWLHSGNPVY